jgi:dTDP-4-amino-4,6-dideoxygalactose transaminase
MFSTMKVPFVDLSPQTKEVETEVNEKITGLMRNSRFVGGTLVDEFEKAFAKMVGVDHCVSVGSGTAALEVALKMLGVGAGDEVITASNSWISSSESISTVGARPVFADVEPNFYCMDVADVERKITSRTKAIIPVHLYGQMAEMNKLLELAEKHSLLILEDAAQAHFSSLDGKNAGSWGNAAAFSFYPSKNLGAFGDAGAIVTNDDELADRLRMFANHGGLKKNEHLIEGTNSRLDTIQAAVLNAKLQRIEKWNSLRVEAALACSELLSGVQEVVVPRVRPNTDHTFHLYVIQAEQRDELKEYLEQKGVSCALHYPSILPLLPAYNDRGYSGNDFPVAYALQQKILSLPMFPHISGTQIEFVVDCIKSFYANR